MKHRSTLGLIALASVVLAAASGHATLYLRDSAPTNGLSPYATGNIYGQAPTNPAIVGEATNAWTAPSSTSVFQINAPGLAYPASVMLSASGASFYVLNSSVNAGDARVLTRAITGFPTNGTLYLSMLLRADTNALTAFTNDVSIGAGFATNTLSGQPTSATIPSNGVYFAFGRNAGVLGLMLNVKGFNYTLVPNPATNTTYFCVARIDIGAGAGGNEIVRAVVNPATPPSTTNAFSVTVETNVLNDSTNFSQVSLAGTYRTSNQRIYFDEILAGSTLYDVAPLSTYAPVFAATPTVTLDASGATLSATLSTVPAGTTLYACFGTNAGGATAASWNTTALMAAPPTQNVACSVALTPLATNTCYTCAALATNADYAVLQTGPTFLTGEIWLTPGSNALEQGMTPGSVIVHRPAVATQNALTVNYTVSGSATAGVHYVSGSLPGSVTIPAGQDTATIPVMPLVSPDPSDETVVLTLASGNYYIGASNQASVTIQNYTFPANMNVWVATAPGNASVAANWCQGRVPIAADDIVLDYFSTSAMTWDAGTNGLPATVASWTQTSNYTGTVTFPIKYTNAVGATFTNFAVTGSVALNGGAWTHPSNTTAQTYRLQSSIGGDFTLGRLGSLRVQGRGYAAGSYPAGGGVGVYGGGRDSYARVYGDVYHPADIGAGANSAVAGGGAIWLEVTGNATVDGAINARAADTGADIGAGGSVYLKAASLAGTGTVSVSGNGYYGCSAGSGGRIAVELTQATSLGMNPTNLTANGGWGSTSAGGGTIFVKAANQANGTLFLDTTSVRSYGCQSPSKYGTTCIPAGQTWTFDSIVFRTSGILSIPPGTTLALPNGLPSIVGTNSSLTCGILYEGGTLALGTGTPYAFTSNWVFQADAPYVITGDVSVARGGALGCLPLRNMTNAVVGMNLSVVGHMNIATDGNVYAVNAGVDYTNYANATVGYHGGQGVTNTTNKGYDSVLNPALPGVLSQSGDLATIRAGGGVVLLTVSSNLVVDGVIQSTSTRGNNWAGAGGTINIRAGTLAGSGSIRANGGAGSSSTYAGGGGRVAIRLTATNSFSAFTATNISATGSSYPSVPTNMMSSAGTVYLQTAADAEGAGQVIVRNDGNTNNAAITWFPSTAGGGETDVLDNVAFLAQSSAVVRLTRSLTLRSAGIETNSSVDLNGATLTVSSMTVNGQRIASGSHPASYFPGTSVRDTSAGATGQVVIIALPAFSGPPTITGSTGTNFLFSATLTDGETNASVFACYGTTQGNASLASWERTKLVTALPATNVAATTTLDTFAADTYYYVSAIATNPFGTALQTGGVFFAGTLWLTAASNAFEFGLVPGAAVVHRPATATGMPLTVNFAISGTATGGIHYASYGTTTTVTFAVGQDTATLPVVPLASPDSDDPAVVFTLMPGPYWVGAASAATVTVVSADAPPVFAGVPAVTGMVDKTFAFSSTLASGTLHTAILACYGANQGTNSAASWDFTRLVTASPASNVPATVTLDTFVTNTCYRYAALATNRNYAIMQTGGVFLAGDVWITTASNAMEFGLTPGAAVVHRATAATGLPLTVRFGLSGTATAGVHYVSYGATNSVTLAAGQDTATLPVVPLTSPDSDDPAVVFTLMPGPYWVGTPGAATVTVVSADTAPVFAGTPTVTAGVDRTFTFSSTLASGTLHTAILACYGATQGTNSAASWDFAPLVTAAPASNVPATVTLDTFVANTCYRYAALATNRNYATLRNGATFLAGDVWLTLGNDAQEGADPGTVIVHRPAEGTQADLPVYYTISGTATAGVHYVTGSLTGCVTIAQGQDTATLTVVSLVNAADMTDRTVVFTLAPGPYWISPTNSATLTIQNSNYNIWIAPTAGYASASNNWSLGRAPLATDDVMLSGSSTNDMIWDAGTNGLPAGVGSWTQTSNYTGTVTFPVSYTNVAGATFTNFAVAGNVAINGGTWTHPSNTTSQAYHLQVAIGGDLALGTAARLNVQGKGYGVGRFPTNGAVGVHAGGRDDFAKVYGDVYHPADIGAANSSAGYTGGGAVWLDIAGTATLNGAVNAKATDGDPGPHPAVGAGGSVYIRAQSVSGTGTINASGNGYYTASSGSGGRIAVELTQAASFGMIATNVTARGGWGSTSTGAGTILIKTATQPYGTLIVDNFAVRSYGCQPPSKYGTTCISAGQTWTFDAIVFRNYGVLSVPTGTTLRLPNGLASVSGTGATPQAGILYMGGAIVLGDGTPYTFTSNWIFQADSPYVITGNVQVARGGALGCIPFLRNTLASYARMNLTVIGDLDIATNGMLVANNAGIDNTSFANATKGYHGGQSATDTTNKAYGSLLNPALPGGLAQSGDLATIQAGGGAVLLTVSGNLNVNGPVSATSAAGGFWPGAGGSINIRAGTLTGTGSIRANGGPAGSSTYGGGGGRVAVRLTQAGATFDAFGPANIGAAGSSAGTTNPVYMSSAGTVYLQTPADGEGAGQVVVRNDNNRTNATAVTWLPSLVSGGEADALGQSALSLEACARVQLATSLVMRSTTIVTNTVLDLNGCTLTLGALTVGGVRYTTGVYTPTNFPFGVADSSAGQTGLIVIPPRGSVFTFE